MNELREMILQERDERKGEAKTMDDFFRSENDQRNSIEMAKLRPSASKIVDDQGNCEASGNKKAKIYNFAN